MSGCRWVLAIRREADCRRAQRTPALAGGPLSQLHRSRDHPTLPAHIHANRNRPSRRSPDIHRYPSTTPITRYKDIDLYNSSKWSHDLSLDPGTILTVLDGT